MPRSEVAARRELSASHRMMQVTERELQRILLDIHDGPVQHMYAALSQLDLLRRALDAPYGQAEARERIERIRLLLEGGLNEVRSFIGAFRPPEFETRELVTLLEGLALQHEAMTDTHIELDVRGPLPDVPLPVKIGLYRVLQEGLSNAYRHGGANRVIVRLRRVVRRGEPRLRMSVSDNGHGFDLRTVPVEKHYGLQGMRDRVEMIGGRFRLRSQPGRGVMIAVEAPIHAEDQG
ncbi:MAG TPA: sensor histidine kinase [Longimicrobium sp.]|nr:sensor histidine kinase [Longimicrobium sp.]